MPSNPISVTVNPQPTYSVKVNNQNDYKVKSVNLVVNRLVNLSDVSAQNPQDGEVLIYNSSSLKFESNRIDSTQMDLINIDAGIF